MSVCDKTLTEPIRPIFQPEPGATESPRVQALISTLGMQSHSEGGYFVETDRDPLRIPNPFQQPGNSDDSTRSAMTTIFYLITPANPKGVFHRNKGRTVHTLHKGRGRYVLIHADEQREGENARIETFVVGPDVQRGEKLQWIVDGGKYKASYLLPDTDGGTESENGLLISETVVPGFEFTDHDFMPPDKLPTLVSAEQSKELSWLLPPRS